MVVDGAGEVEACKVICWLLCVKAILGIEKSAWMEPSVLSHSMPKTTSAPSMGRR